MQIDSLTIQFIMRFADKIGLLGSYVFFVEGITALDGTTGFSGYLASNY